MKVIPYLTFDGHCEEAFKFYETALNCKIAFKMTYGESPMAEKVDADWKNKVMHTAIRHGEMEIAGADAPKGMYSKPQGYSVMLDLDGEAEAERIFKTLSEKGTVKMPLQETFWAKRFGMLVDKFGTPWMINCHKPM